MDTAIIASGVTYRQGCNALNYAFSGTANLNAIAPEFVTSPTPYSVTTRDFTIYKNGINAVSLPLIVTRGHVVTIINDSGGPVNVVPDGAGNIDGVGGPYVLNNGQRLTLISSAPLTWYIIGKVL